MDELFKAVSHGTVADVRQLLDTGADPNARNPNSEPVDMPLLMTAILERAVGDAVTPELVKLLLDRGAECNTEWPSESQYTALAAAVIAEDIETVTVLLGAGALPDQAILWVPDDAYAMPGLSPRLLAGEMERTDMLSAMLESHPRQIPDCGREGILGLWQLVAYQYEEYDECPVATWDDDPGEHGWIQLKADGTFTGRDCILPCDRLGTWELDGDSLVLMDDSEFMNAELVLRPHCLHVLCEERTDGVTGRGTAHFYYVHTAAVHGLPQQDIESSATTQHD